MAVNDKLEKLWKEAVMAYFRYYSSSSLDWLRKTMKTK